MSQADSAHLQTIRHWIFDMDGTLTLAKHDFAMIKKVLEIPEDEDILTNLDALPTEDRKARLRWLAEYELKIAKETVTAIGALTLLDHLSEQKSEFAILTRNLQDLAFITLEAAGIDHFFTQELIIGRMDAAPKPSPAGILKILQAWNIEPHETVIVGDHEYDLAAGKNAGIATILINEAGNIYPDLADYYFPNCETLLHYLKS